MFNTRRQRPLAAVATALLLAGGVAACGDDDDDNGGGGAGSDASFTLKIGDLVPLTGDLSSFGPPGRKAADLAVAQIKQAVREAGADITVEQDRADTETREQSAVQAARKLVSGGANCLTGAWASSSTIPVGTTVAARERVPMVSPASTSAEITDMNDNGFVFRTAPSDNLQGVALADAIEQELGGTDKTISLAARNDAYGEGLINRVKDAWEERGGRTTGPVAYDPEQPSFNSEAGKIVAGNPDAYVIVDFPETFQKMGAALVRTGRYDAAKLFTTDGLASDEIPEGIPAQALRGAKGTRPGTPEGGQLAEGWHRMFVNAPGPGRQTFDAQNFDATMLCFLAAVAAGSNDGQDIQEAMTDVSGPGGTKYDYTQLAEAITALQNGEDIDYEGVTGPVDFDENGDPTTATYEVWAYGDDGKIAVKRQFEAKKDEAAN